MSRIYMRASSIDRKNEAVLGSDEDMTIRVFIGSSPKNSEEILTVNIQELEKGHFSISAAGRAATAVEEGEYIAISAKGKEKSNK